MIVNNQRTTKALEAELEQFSSVQRMERSLLKFGGTVIGTVVGFAHDGAPLVDLPGTPVSGQVSSRSCIRLTSSDVGRKAVLIFEGDDPTLPVIIGLIQVPTTEPIGVRVEVAVGSGAKDIEVDGKNVEVIAKESITLRCGDASITLRKDGKIVIRGKHVVSHAAGVNRIRGGSVQLN